MLTTVPTIAANNSELPKFAGMQPKIELLVNSKPYSKHCLLDAKHDLAAVTSWLKQHSQKATTFTAYKREAERLLLWCIYEAGKTLNQLKIEDVTRYFEFLKNPPITWCATRTELKIGKQGNDNWRPFLGPLSRSALNTAIRIINSLLNYLVDANYLRANPIRLIKKHDKFMEPELQKYTVWNRMLEEDEWEALQAILQHMPEENVRQIDNKMRTQFLFALFYLLGLRIHEVATSSWNAFREHQGNWWFFVKGKGDKPGHIPVNDQLLHYIRTYRLYLGKSALPTVADPESLLVSKKTKRPLSTKQLYSLVKEIGELTAKSFPDDPRKQHKLRKLSPHWLRHLSASHQNKVGIPVTMIRENHRHSSIQTTQIYVHTEDKLRFQEMQKVTMRVVPTVKEKPEKLSTVNLTLTLKSNSICEEYSFIRLLDVIETVILQGFNWQVNKPRKVLLAIFNQHQIYKQAFTVQYTIRDVKDIVVITKLEQFIIREANIRLFSCKFELDFSSKSQK
jgi:site-specific recombinase XerD